MQLWGSAVDGALATAYKLPNDAQIHLPPSPSLTSDEPEATASNAIQSSLDIPIFPTPAPIDSVLHATSKTKSLLKPTAHLPDDHGDALGESHVALDPTIPTSTAQLDEQLDSSPSSSKAPTYLGAMSSLLVDQSWLFFAAGAVVVFVSGLSIFFLMRRAKRRKQGSSSGYTFEPVPDDEGGSVPMREMELGRAGGLKRSSVVGGTGTKTTKDLYDAFGVSSDSDDDDAEDEVATGQRAYKDEVRRSELTFTMLLMTVADLHEQLSGG